MARIAIVEDDPELGELLADYLSILGHETTIYRSTVGVLSALDTIEVVITDVSLDGESGLTLCQRIAGRVPVVVVSGDGSNRTHAAAAGAAQFYQKPVDLAGLCDTVDQLAKPQRVLATEV